MKKKGRTAILYRFVSRPDADGQEFRRSPTAISQWRKPLVDEKLRRFGGRCRHLM